MNVEDNKTAYYLARYNDAMVLLMSYFPLLFTDFILDLETRYSAGWMYIAVVALMVIVNLSVVVKGTILEIV